MPILQPLRLQEGVMERLPMHKIKDVLRLYDSVMISATRSTSSRPRVAPGNSTQSTWACAPGGVSTRRRARIFGAGYVRFQYRCTDFRLPV